MFKLHEVLSDALREELSSYDDLTAALLSRRGIKNKIEAEAFLSPSYDKHIHDPMLMLDMPKAAERVKEALNNKERITIWSDYDCDGIPGGVLLHDFMKKAGANFTNYIPHRHLEGYGVNVAGIEKLAQEGTKLIITVDSGITDVAAVARANELGMEVIVTDHHLPAEELPPAFAILNPNAREEETYPYKSLCGSGVAWKLVCAVLALGFEGREQIPVGWEKWLLDMAGLATIADMVPLTGENRVITKYGLMVMRKSPRLGLQKLCKVARVNQRFIAEDDVGFMIAPRINAASRMGDPRDAFRLLTTQDEVEAEELAKSLESINRSRRAAAGAITKAVHTRLEVLKEEGKDIPSVIVMGDPDWRPGLLGLVASGISDEYERPVFLWGREGNEVLKGSCRGGPEKVHVVELMQAADEGTFMGFGGHQAAGGFSVRPEAVFELPQKLVEARERLSHTSVAEESLADLWLTPKEITSPLLKRLEQLAPFGMGNPKPTVALQEVLVDRVAWFGKASEHLRIHISRESQEEFLPSIEAIAFFARRDLGKSPDTLKPGNRTNMLVYVERDQFSRGQPVRLRLIGIK
ncbi:MAG: single-stranded-DNA-specific exonuclease RecJ [Candidatus Pacebacteria bacterium]|nr:single-stranded-DNA-specific exonuclease RecJ [Candidatus Paceibacterota bacterium]